MKTVTVGIVGAGRATELHCSAYKKVCGIDVRLKSIFDAVPEKAAQAKERYGTEQTADTLEALLLDKEIDVIDICTPPYTHKDIIISALRHGKNVICEKPLTGYFGSGTTDGETKLRSVEKDVKEIENALNESGKIFMYAENFIYAPSVIKAAEIIKAKKSRILYAKGEESLAGSSSPVAGRWDKTGGGSLIRVGTHPLSAILYLKKLNDPSVCVTSVKADIGCVTKELGEYEHRHIKASPQDVEDTATVCLGFSDNTKAVVIACDTRLGGSRNYLELYCNDAMLECNITMNDTMKTYLLDEDGMDNVELSEMLSTKTGWNEPFISDEIMRGYTNEMQDFMECVRDARQPLSGFETAKETVLTIYKAYSVS